MKNIMKHSLLLLSTVGLLSVNTLGASQVDAALKKIPVDQATQPTLKNLKTLKKQINRRKFNFVDEALAAVKKNIQSDDLHLQVAAAELEASLLKHKQVTKEIIDFGKELAKSDNDFAFMRVWEELLKNSDGWTEAKELLGDKALGEFKNEMLKKLINQNFNAQGTPWVELFKKGQGFDEARKIINEEKKECEVIATKMGGSKNDVPHQISVLEKKLNNFFNADGTPKVTKNR